VLVVILSAEGASGREGALVTAGAACLTKPLDVRKFRRTVDHALKGRDRQH
jgi:hypothetical protein